MRSESRFSRAEKESAAHGPPHLWPRKFPASAGQGHLGTFGPRCANTRIHIWVFDNPIDAWDACHIKYSPAETDQASFLKREPQIIRWTTTQSYVSKSKEKRGSILDMATGEKRITTLFVCPRVRGQLCRHYTDIWSQRYLLLFCHC